MVSVESFAYKVSQGDTDAEVLEKGGSLELQNMKQSIRHMVKKLDLRYRALQESREALASAEQQYRSIFENALVGIFRFSAEGKFTAANSAMSQILGFNDPDDLMSSITDIRRQLCVRPEDVKRFLTMVESDAGSMGYESKIRRNDGKEIWGALFARAVREPGGNSCITTEFSWISPRASWLSRNWPK